MIDDFLNDFPPAGRPAERGGSGGAGASPDLNDFRPGGQATAGEAGGKGEFRGGGSPPDLND